MKTLLAFLFSLFSVLFWEGPAFAQTSISLSTPHQAPVPAGVTCAIYTTTAAYSTVVTGFSADGNYVTGQVNGAYVCGHSGHGSTITRYNTCTTMTWDLSGNTVGVSSTAGGCAPVAGLVLPATQPPSQTVVGNEFTNAGGYIAETLITEACGSIACYATYYYPTLVTP